jgi:hypothetical protein
MSSKLWTFGYFLLTKTRRKTPAIKMTRCKIGNRLAINSILLSFEIKYELSLRKNLWLSR